MGGIAMFLFKQESRNAFDSLRKESTFKKNYFRAFKLRLPSSDAIEDLLRLLAPGELELLKTALVKELIKRKVFCRFRFMAKQYIISIDGTGVSSYKSDYCGECTSKTSKKGNTTYFHNVLEAKLVTSNDMSISIATEWVRNEAGKEYDKQDCELKAFIRLSKKIKQLYPKLPLVILADGLYPNQTFFQVCKDNGWDFIVTFKDGNLPSVHEEIGLLPDSAKHKRQYFGATQGYSIRQDFEWVNCIDYKGHSLSVINCNETKTSLKTKKSETSRFAYITNIDISPENYIEVFQCGRMRWRIENGFDYLKNHGYNLGHKFSRVSFNAYKNYYQCMMIAHFINQLVEKSIDFIEIMRKDNKTTIKYLWKRLLGYLTEISINQQEYEEFIRKRVQIRLA